MPRVPESDNLPFGMKQKHTYGCIATNLAAILQSFGARAMLWENDDGHPMLLPVDESLLIQLYYKASVGFDKVEGCEMLSKVGVAEAYRHQFTKRCSFDEWWKTVTHHIGEGHYVLISYKVQNGWHIVTAYEETNGVLSLYNPDKNANARTSLHRSELEEMWSHQPEREVDPAFLVVKRSQQPA